MIILEFEETEGYKPKYAALSYIWGGIEAPQLKLSAKDGVPTRLKSPGGLGDH